MRPTVIQGSFPRGLQQTAQTRNATVQRTGSGTAMQLPSWPPPHVTQGRPLEPAVRQLMEAAFGQQFADVRIHIGAEAQAIGAVAFTHGSNIHFAPGSYDPSTPRGRQLLAHELAHVVQQRTGRVRNAFGSGAAIVHDAQLEAEAERLAARVAQRAQSAPRVAAASPVAQRLTYTRFGWFSFMQSYNAQEVRINTLLDTLRTNIADSKAHFAKVRSWMPPPGELRDIEHRFTNIDTGQYAETQYQAIEQDLRTLDARLRQLRTAWKNVRWVESDPLGFITRHVVPVKDTLYKYSGQEKNLKYKEDLRWFVEQLFGRFVRYGFRYEASIGGGDILLGSDANSDYVLRDPVSLDRYGSCLTFACAFAKILKKYDIDARAGYVVPQDQMFIAKIPSFIDSRITGNLEFDGQKKPGYFVFCGHGAVWVNKLKKWYDPMARTTYSDISEKTECTLSDDPAHQGRFRIDSPCRTLTIGMQPVSSRNFYLTADPTRRVGGLATYVLHRKNG